MKALNRFAALTGVTLTLSLGGQALAQRGGFGGGGFQNMDPQQMQGILQQAQTMDPQQLQDLAQQYRNMDPQQRQEALQQLQTMDPQQMLQTLQQRANVSLREELGITNDAEWLLIDEKIKAVTKARAAVAADGGGAMGLAGLRGGVGGGRGGTLAGAAGRLSPEAKALQAAIEANAPAGEIKNLMANLREAREAKRAVLVKAQAELRALLTFRQEASAVLRGVLD